VDHAGVFVLQSHRLKNQVIILNFRQVYQGVSFALVQKYERQTSFANFALKMLPIDTRAMRSLLLELLRLQPVFDAQKVDVLDSSSTQTYLQ